MNSITVFVTLQTSEDYEIIFVNDGSPDNAVEVAIALYQRRQSARS